MVDQEVMTARVKRMWDVQDKITALRKEAADCGLLVETKARFYKSGDILTNGSHIRVIDPLSGSVASFEAHCMRSSGMSGAREADFARKKQTEFFELRSALVDSQADMVLDVNWSALSGPNRPLKITVWSEKGPQVRGVEMEALKDSEWGWLSEEDIIHWERRIYNQADLFSMYDFYTIEF